MDENVLARLAWTDLLQMRRDQPDQASQDRLAPFEHRAYAREQVAQNPLLAPAYALMVPGYQALKMLRGGARTEPSLEQLLQGWRGIADGLR